MPGMASGTAQALSMRKPSGEKDSADRGEACLALLGLRHDRVWQKVGGWEGGSWTVSGEARSVGVSESLCKVPSQLWGVYGGLGDTVQYNTTGLM